MIIGEPIYLACLVPVVAAAYFVPGGWPRQVFLLAVSYAYYLTFPLTFFVVLLALTYVAYAGGLLLEGAAEKRWGGGLLTAFILLALTPLCAFKYLLPLFAAGPHHEGANWQLTMAQIVLPIGLSFYTFAAIGYMIDVYVGVASTAARNPLRVALFTGFFPYVTAGPIPRTTDILAQLDLRARFDADRAMQGVREILLGVLMKFWIADSLAIPSAAVYSNLASSQPLEKLVATVLFAFQLYTDFAGYSLIAIGSARLLGVDVPDNFRQPYLSQSLAEFWRHWHISLLNWLRDYVYTPLSLRWRRHPRIAIPAATFITLVLVGMWHGSGWGFVVFGIVHGIYLTLALFTKRWRERIVRALTLPPAVLIPLRVLITFSFVALSLVLIRAESLTEALAIYRDIFSVRLLDEVGRLFAGRWDTFANIHFAENITNMALIAAVIVGDILARTKFHLAKLPSLAQGTVYAASILTVLYQVIAAGAPRLFAYFQF